MCTSKEKELNTMWSVRYYKQQKKAIEEYESDINKEQRKEERECKACHYLKGGGALQSFTEYTCKHCKKKSAHYDSRVPKYCNKCSDTFDICVRCGADI
ncbi:hypothetical protein [Bacillus wiedmannii]|uniref:hypothetical protein n=1 Tax=Bacillus wiedmannii TaxID=1890302 RepID=UPI000BF25624|nr:hypothetical protein [Bacillus wiedmannii]PEP21502.1 hypothetical protein CN580_21250 [Bacillus wiedmannii]